MFFTAIFLSAWGVILMVRSWLYWLPGTILLACGAFVAYGLMILGLRAYTALFALSVVLICASQFRNKGLYVRLLPMIVAACVWFWPKLMSIAHLLWIKQQSIGTNGKVGEWLSVIHTIFLSPKTALFGIGWGGILNNPIYQSESTRFTHSVLSFFLLKSGVLGLVTLLLIAAIFLFGDEKRTYKKSPSVSCLIILVSCFSPLLVGVLFEPIYKMLSYGVILSLFLLSMLSMGTIERKINV